MDLLRLTRAPEFLGQGGEPTSSLPASAQVDSRIQQLMEMGFDEKISERALRRCKPAGDCSARFGYWTKSGPSTDDSAPRTVGVATSVVRHAHPISQVG